jgi:hypothetical protein
MADLKYNNTAFKTEKIGNLQLLVVGNVAIGCDTTTGECGFLTKIINGTGGASVKGSVVHNADAADDKFELQDSEYDAIGVVAVGGVADGSPTWIWKNGSRCQTLWKDDTTATRGYVALCADTDGRAINVEVPSANPVVAEHFKEIGHVCESNAGGTNVLVLVELHFN